MKKIVLVVPILLLTGCTSDLSIGPIGLLDIIVLASSAVILIVVVLQLLGWVKECPQAGQTTVSVSLFGFGILLSTVTDLVVGLSETMETVIGFLGVVLIFGALFAGYRAFKEERNRSSEHQIED